MSRKACRIEVLTIDCYDNANKSLGIGYLNNIPILFKPSKGFDPATQPACRNGRTCFMDEFCILNTTSITCYDGMLFLIDDNLWGIRNGCWIIEDK